jgi:hypothetical protein
VEERKDLDVQALAHGFALIEVDFQKGHIRVFCRYFEKLRAEKDGTLEREISTAAPIMGQEVSELEARF